MVIPWVSYPYPLGDRANLFLPYKLRGVWDRQVMPRRGWHTSEYCSPSQDSWAWVQVDPYSRCPKVQVDPCSRCPKVLPFPLLSEHFLEEDGAGLNLGLYSGIKGIKSMLLGTGFGGYRILGALMSLPCCFDPSISIMNIWSSNVYWIMSTYILNASPMLSLLPSTEMYLSRATGALILLRHLLRECQLSIFC